MRFAVYFRASVQEETMHAAEEEEVQEEDEEDMEEEEQEENATSQFQQRTYRHWTSSQSDRADKTRLCTRRIIAEDPSWTLSIVPSLTNICVRCIADHFCC